MSLLRSGFGPGLVERSCRFAFLSAVVFFAIVANALAQGPSSTQSGPGVAPTQSDPVGGSSPVMLSNVPAYNWYHGCGPTAAGSIIGYYDLHGFDNLFTASGWDAVKLTANVQDQISSPAHNAKYDPTPDNTSLPVPPNTSLACWFRTSVDPLNYGWAYLSYADDAFRGYVNYRGYQCNSWNETYGTQFTWQDLVGEINAGRPLMFLVDTDGNGGTDHFVPVFGYDDRGAGGLWYGCYTTWSEAETVAWYQFRAMGQPWGVGYATFVQVVPEPRTLVLLGLGGVGALAYPWRQKRAARTVKQAAVRWHNLRRMLVAVFLTTLLTTSAAQAQLTYELRTIPGSGSEGVMILDSKNIQITPAVGDHTFGVDIYAVIANHDNNHANDGLTSGYLSFQSIAVPNYLNLPANITGCTMDGSGPPYTGFWNSPLGGPRYGTLHDIDGDGDTDLGSTRGPDVSTNFFGPSADPAEILYVSGTGTGTDPTEIHIGTLSVKVTDPAPRQGMTMHVLPRYKASTSIMHYWVEDGVGLFGTGRSTTLGTGTGLVFSGADVFVTVTPEPCALVLLGLGGIAAATYAWRRKRQLAQPRRQR